MNLLTTPFETKPPRLKDLINRHVMGDVWLRDTPFGPVTDSLILAKKFKLEHSKILRAVNKCRLELTSESKFELEKNLIENNHLVGPKGREREKNKKGRNNRIRVSLTVALCE